MSTKIIELVNQDLSYEKRARLHRRTLSFKTRFCTREYSVLLFGWMSYKMWATKIYGGYKEKFFGKARK